MVLGFMHIKLYKMATFTVIPGNVFCNSAPFVIGVMINKGSLNINDVVFSDGVRFGVITAMETNRKRVTSVPEGSRVVIRIDSNFFAGEEYRITENEIFTT